MSSGAFSLFSSSAIFPPISGKTKNSASSKPAEIKSIPLSVSSTEFCFSSIIKNSGSVTMCMFLLFSCMYRFSVFCITAFMPSSLKNLMIDLFLGIPLWARNKSKPPSFFSSEVASGLVSRRLASINILLTNSRCARYNFST